MIKFINKKKLLIIISLLFFFTLIQTNFFKNIFELSTTNYNQRIINAEGFCEKRGIGYVNFIKEKYNINEKIRLITADKEPSLWSVFSSNFDKKETSKHIIIINFNSIKTKIDLEEYKIINKFKDCYYLIR
tara:strand:- start:1527 stop:1919 length:393 start_codon:yes stop_codon:yes gene_type:complete